MIEKSLECIRTANEEMEQARIVAIRATEDSDKVNANHVGERN